MCQLAIDIVLASYICYTVSRQNSLEQIFTRPAICVRVVLPSVVVWFLLWDEKTCSVYRAGFFIAFLLYGCVSKLKHNNTIQVLYHR